MTENEVAERLRRAREERGLSQRQLAAAAGITGSMISMIEQGRTSPSVATLKKILTGLGMSLGDFFAEDEAATGQWHYKAGELREINPEATFGTQKPDSASRISFRQVGAAGQSTIQMLHEHYPRGADTGPERYAHEGEETGIVIEGQIEITVGGETRTLARGDAYLFDSRQPHRFRNVSGKPCTIVSACTPPTF